MVPIPFKVLKIVFLNINKKIFKNSRKTKQKKLFEKFLNTSPHAAIPGTKCLILAFSHVMLASKVLLRFNLYNL